MKYYSTNNKNLKISFKEAVLKGLSEDNGLFMPEKIEKLDRKFFENLNRMSFTDIGSIVSQPFIGNEIPKNILDGIIEEAFDFPAPLVKIEKNVYSLELFHGPTLAFKDFGARFMARVMSYFQKESKDKLTILVATSGDTGSAVASAFYGIDNIEVKLLYPKGKVSEIQEKQLTTFGKNIEAFSVDGTFDECQTMVKKAFVDEDLKKQMKLTSANSINISRLIPQLFYFFEIFSKLSFKNNCVNISVPSGNFGNLTAGLIAKKMGLPIERFMASTNINDVVPEYLKTGVFRPRKSKTTISNAMDVGNPSNFMRILDLLETHEKINESIKGYSFSDFEIKSMIAEVYKKNKYIMDPHGAIGYLGLKAYLKNRDENNLGIFLETAHPGKFKDDVEEIIDKKLEIPERLQQSLKKESFSKTITNNFDEFKEYLLSNH